MPTILSSILPVGKTTGKKKKREYKKIVGEKYKKKNKKICGSKWRTRKVGVGESATLRRNIMRYLGTYYGHICVNIVLNNRISIVTRTHTLDIRV